MALPTDIFNHMLAPDQGDFSPEHAKYVLNLDFTEAERNRCEELSYKAQEGTLSPEEVEELDWYLLADTFLTALQSKARRSLEQRPSAA